VSTPTYEEVLHQARCLMPDEQLRLIEELAAIIRRQVTARPKHSVTEFKGMGKEGWEGIDVEKYIDEERNSWDQE
jgi:hypothetical protein